MSARTIFLSRLIGLYCVLVSLPLVMHKEASMATVNVLVQNSSSLFILGVITMAAGLALVLGHNLWSGGMLTVIVTLVGWVTLIKGLLFLLLSPEAVVGLLAALRYQQLYYWYTAISILIGVYLTYGGFKSTSG